LPAPLQTFLQASAFFPGIDKLDVRVILNGIKNSGLHKCHGTPVGDGFRSEPGEYLVKEHGLGFFFVWRNTYFKVVAFQCRFNLFQPNLPEIVNRFAHYLLLD